MKILALLFSSFILAGTVFASGVIDIAYTPYTISTPGSYIVVKDLKITNSLQTAISITTSNVSLDLNGHTLYGLGTAAGAFGSGVYAGFSIENVKVFNGTLRDFSGSGAWVDGNNNQVYNVHALGNGFIGIFLGNNGIAHDNIVENNVGGGIDVGNYALVRNNTVVSNYNIGIEGGNYGDSIQDNTISTNSGVGIYVINNSRISGNTLDSNATTGILGEENCSVTHNNLSNNGSGGIQVDSNCIVDGNNVTTSVSDGIRVNGENGIVTNNMVYYSGGWGINGGFYCTFQNNAVYSNSSGGIFSYSYAIINRNNTIFNFGDGINCGYSSKISDNNCSNNGYGSSTGYGIHVFGLKNSIENNLLTDNDRGLQIDTSGNYFAGNRFRNNTINISTSAGNTGGDGNTGFTNIVIP